MHGGRILAGEWDSWEIQCLHCEAFMKASSLKTHLASQHVVYQVVTVPEDYMVPCTAVMYQTDPKYNGRLPWPIPRCLGEHKDGWMLRRHFQDLHPFDEVIKPKEGYFPWCEWCFKPIVPPSCLDEGMPGRNGPPATMGVGNSIGSCPSSRFHDSRECPRTS